MEGASGGPDFRLGCDPGPPGAPGLNLEATGVNLGVTGENLGVGDGAGGPRGWSVSRRHRLGLGLGLDMELDLRLGLGLGLHMEVRLALRLGLGQRLGAGSRLPGRQGAVPPGAGLVLDLEMNGVETGGGTYPDDTRALKGSFLVMSSSSEDRESISRSILLTLSLGCGGSCMGTSGPPSSTSGGGGEGKISSSKGAGGNGSSIGGGGEESTSQGALRLVGLPQHGRRR